MVIPKLKELYERTLYVWRVSGRPDNKELVENFRVVMIGIIIMGFLGFFISILFNFIQS